MSSKKEFVEKYKGNEGYDAEKFYDENKKQNILLITKNSFKKKYKDKFSSLGIAWRNLIHLELYDIIWNNLSAWKINNKTGMPTSETNFLIDKLILEAHFYTTPKDKFIKIYSKENKSRNI